MDFRGSHKLKFPIILIYRHPGKYLEYFYKIFYDLLTITEKICPVNAIQAKICEKYHI
jgi:hypothetical protein